MSAQKKIIGPHINDALKKLIKGSYVLKQKLTNDQIEKFIQKSFTLSNKGKLDLLTQLEQEQHTLSLQKPDTQKTLQSLHDWNGFVGAEVQREKKGIMKKGEEESENKDIQLEEQLLQNLKDL